MIWDQRYATEDCVTCTFATLKGVEQDLLGNAPSRML